MGGARRESLAPAGDFGPRLERGQVRTEGGGMGTLARVRGALGSCVRSLGSVLQVAGVALTLNLVERSD